PGIRVDDCGGILAKGGWGTGVLELGVALIAEVLRKIEHDGRASNYAPFVKWKSSLSLLQDHGQAARAMGSQDQDLLDVGGAARTRYQTDIGSLRRETSLLNQGHGGFQVRNQLFGGGENDVAVGHDGSAPAAAARGSH